MNPSQLAVPFVAIALLAAAAWFAWHRLRALVEQRKQKTAAAIAEASRAGFLQGLHHGMRNWGAHVKAVQGIKVHGFAEACRGCGLVAGNLISMDDEYWTCQQCKHRNPAPMPFAPLPKPPTEVRHDS